MELIQNLSNKISRKEAKIGIIGMGYVGSALADIVLDAGFEVLGFVTSQQRADTINRQKRKKLSATTDTSLIKTRDILLVCIQTPIHENKKPDLSFLEKACQQIARNLEKGQLIVIESSIAPGTTRNVALPILESTGLKAGTDFFLAFSPERVDPGNKKFSLSDIPKVVSGLDKATLEITAQFYGVIFKKVVPVSSIEAAEMVKIFENTFRFVNISLVFEVQKYTDALGLDMWEIINAASTKPFGFLAHYPSPGIGGHCIPVDPYYLIDDAKRLNIDLKLVKTAGKINDEQITHVANKIKYILQKTNGEKIKHKALLIGITYKPDVSDTRESPAIRIWEKLSEDGIEVSYHDSFVPRYNGSVSITLQPDIIAEHDIVVITTNHSNIVYQELLMSNKPVLDTKNVYKGIKHPLIYRL